MERTELKLAIMQPYFMPYIGYFQLLMAADRFVIYDDVNFINRGWINRNNILVGGKAHRFTIPLLDASQNRLIHELRVATEGGWQKKFLKTVQQAYVKAPQYAVFYPLLEEMVNYESTSVADYCHYSFKRLKAYLGLPVEIVVSSERYTNTDLKAADRILDICKQEGATDYINAAGGMELYSKEAFASEGINLHFVKSNLVPYPQLKNEFVAGLSMIDVLMFNDQSQALALLNNYELV